MAFPLFRPNQPPPPLGDNGNDLLIEAGKTISANALRSIELQRQQEQTAEAARHNQELEAQAQGQLGVQRHQLAGLEESRKADLNLKTQEYQLKAQQDQEKQDWERAKRLKAARVDLAAASDAKSQSGIAMAQAELDSLGVTATREGEAGPVQTPGSVPVQTDLSAPPAPLALGMGPIAAAPWKPRPILPTIESAMRGQGPVSAEAEPTPGSPELGIPAPQGPSGTPAVSPPTAGQGALQAPPSLGMGLPPAVAPQAPPEKPQPGDWWVLRDKKTGQEITRWSHAQAMQEGYDALKEQFADLLDARDPSVRQAAEVAYNLHRARLGFTPTPKVLEDAAKDAVNMRRALGPKGLGTGGAGAGAGPTKEQKFDVAHEKELDSIATEAVTTGGKIEDMKKLQEAHRAAEKLAGMLSSVGPGAATEQLLGLDQTLRQAHGRAVNYAEYQRVAGSGGAWANLQQKLNYVLEEGHLSDAVLAGLKEAAAAALASTKEAIQAEADSARDWAMSSARVHSPEEAQWVGGRVYNRFTGTGGVTPSPSTQSYQQKYGPKKNGSTVGPQKPEDVRGGLGY